MRNCDVSLERRQREHALSTRNVGLRADRSAKDSPLDSSRMTAPRVALARHRHRRAARLLRTVTGLPVDDKGEGHEGRRLQKDPS